MTKHYNFSRCSGFSLLGALFAGFIAAIVIAALAGQVAQVYGVGRQARDRFIAANLAKEGLELVRDLRNSNWLFYTSDPATSAPATKMQWRGEAADSPCGGAYCSRLRSICDGADYVIDAFDADLRLKNGDGDLYLADGKYTHETGAGAKSSFNRKITISTDASNDSDDDYLDAADSNCGVEVNSDPLDTLNYKRPAPIIVKATVTWTPAGSATAKSMELTEVLYDWLMKRP